MKAVIVITENFDVEDRVIVTLDLTKAEEADVRENGFDSIEKTADYVEDYIQKNCMHPQYYKGYMLPLDDAIEVFKKEVIGIETFISKAEDTLKENR